MIYQGKARAPVHEVILHCAAIRAGQFNRMSPLQVFSIINRWHTERGFRNGFGYHGLFMPDGTFYPGRPYSMLGAHVVGRNVGTLGFLLIETRQVTRVGEFGDWFTSAQGDALRAKLASIPGIQRVSGHNDYARKLCPGFEVETSDWL